MTFATLSLETVLPEAHARDTTGARTLGEAADALLLIPEARL